VTKFAKTVEISKRKVDFVADNVLSEAINLAAVEICEELLQDYPFTHIPHLRINILGSKKPEDRFLEFAAGLSARYETAGHVDPSEIVTNHISNITLNLDVALAPILASHMHTMTQEYIDEFNAFQIPAEEKKVFIERVRKHVTHEATHILQILEGTFLQAQIGARQRLQGALKEYTLLLGEEEKEFIKLLRSAEPEFNVSPEREFIENILKRTRNTLKMFVDLLLVEGIAEYSGTLAQYPFDINFLHGQYEQLKKIVNDKVVTYFRTLTNMGRKYSEIILEEKEHPALPKLSPKQILDFEKPVKRMFQDIQGAVYDIGPHMVYVILFGNEKLSVTDLIKMNRMQFIAGYEEACHNLGLRPLVSVTSGKGIFDYKKALEEWSAAAKHLEKL